MLACVPPDRSIGYVAVQIGASNLLTTQQVRSDIVFFQFFLIDKNVIFVIVFIIQKEFYSIIVLFSLMKQK